MEAAEALNDATPPLIEEQMPDQGDVFMPDESNGRIADPEDSVEESMSVAMDAVDAVIDHAAAVVDDEPAMDVGEGEEMTGGEGGIEGGEEPKEDEEGPKEEEIEEERGEKLEEEEADLDDGSTRDTLPMYDEDKEKAEETTDETVEAVKTMEEEVKEPSPSTEGEASQPLPDSSEAADAAGAAEAAEAEGTAEAADGAEAEAGEAVEAEEGGETGEELSNNEAQPALTFPHCYVCGFDRETVFMKEKKAPSGQHKNKLLYRNRCVRKACIRFFGPSYVWNSKGVEFVRVSEESANAVRPYASAPREEKFPDLDYARAAESGVRPPVDNNGAAARTARAARAAMAAAAGTGAEGGTSDSPSLPRTPSASTSNSPAPPAKAASATKASPSTSSSKPSTSRGTGGGQKKSSAAPPKKPRKGYEWVVEDDAPDAPPPDRVMELARMLAMQSSAAATAAKVKESLSESREFGIQTGDDFHVYILAEELRTKASFQMDLAVDSPEMATLSHRLFLTQHMLRMQTQEIKGLREERDLYKKNLTSVEQQVIGYRKDLVADITRLKEDVQMAGKDLRNFMHEMQNEANKDIRDINKIKVQVAQRIDDMDRMRRKVEASLEYQKSLTEEADMLAETYHRVEAELSSQLIDARTEEEYAHAKLRDKIYLKDNERCTHCQVNERIKNMLTEQIADKTLSANNLGKERVELAKKLENSERIRAIVSKENEKLKFEKSAWEMNCHRFLGELAQLRGTKAGLVLASMQPCLPSSLPPTQQQQQQPPGEAAFTPMSTSTKETDEISPERSDDSVEMERPAPTSSTSSAEEGEYKSPQSPTSLARLPPPPPPPAQILQPAQKEPSPEGAAGFANWIPKDRKEQEMPSGMAEAFRKVQEALEKGRPPREEKKGPPKKEKDKERGKRSGAHPSSSHHKNGEKKPKLDGGMRKEEKVVQRPIPTLGAPKGPSPQVPPKEKERRKEERRRDDPSPIPFTSAHEPAFPAVVTKKPAVKVPYNGPSSLIAGASSTPVSAHPSPRPGGSQGRTPEKKVMSFLPVAGSSALPPLPPQNREPPRQHQQQQQQQQPPLDAILREAERLRMREREREMRRDRDHLDVMRTIVAVSAQAVHQQQRQPPPMNGGFDDDLPWNQGRAPAGPPRGQRPRTPVQDWYYEEPAGGHGPPPQHLQHQQQQPRPRSPSRYYDDAMYDPRAPRDQFGRLDPSMGGMRHPAHHPGGPPPQHLHPQHPQQHPQHPQHLQPPAYRGGAPPPHQQAPPPRRDWQEPSWSGEPPRRGYWD